MKADIFTSAGVYGVVGEAPCENGGSGVQSASCHVTGTGNTPAGPTTQTATATAEVSYGQIDVSASFTSTPFVTSFNPYPWAIGSFQDALYFPNGLPAAAAHILLDWDLSKVACLNTCGTASTFYTFELPVHSSGAYQFEAQLFVGDPFGFISDLTSSIKLNGFSITDPSGNPISLAGYTYSSQSGTRYDVAGAEFAPIPEPASWMLFTSGAMLVGLILRKR